MSRPLHYSNLVANFRIYMVVGISLHFHRIYCENNKFHSIVNLNTNSNCSFFDVIVIVNSSNRCDNCAIVLIISSLPLFCVAKRLTFVFVSWMQEHDGCWYVLTLSASWSTLLTVVSVSQIAVTFGGSRWRYIVNSTSSLIKLFHVDTKMLSK